MVPCRACPSFPSSCSKLGLKTIIHAAPNSLAFSYSEPNEAVVKHLALLLIEATSVLIVQNSSRLLGWQKCTKIHNYKFLSELETNFS